MSQSTYKVEAGEEDQIVVMVSVKNGQQLAEPKKEVYSVAMWPSVSKLPGLVGEVVHDPRTAAAKKEVKVSASTVKAETELTEDEQYADRYRVLFKSNLPDELVGNPERVKTIVDRAEAKLAAFSKDEEVVNELVFQDAGVTKTAPEFGLDGPITEATEPVTEPAPTKKGK